MLVGTIFYASTLAALFAFAASMFLWAGWTDIREMRIPNMASLGLIVAWVARAVLLTDTTSPLDDFLFAAAIFVSFFFLYSVASGGFGAGDVKLITAGSLWFGWSPSPLELPGSDYGPLPMGMVFLFSLALVGFVQSLSAIILARMGFSVGRSGGAKVRIPYGPSIVAGAAFAAGLQFITWGIA